MADDSYTPDEEWRAIPGHEGYAVSTLGRVRSLDRILELNGPWGPMRRRHHGRVLRLKRKPNGWGVEYLQFFAGGNTYLHVHRVICLTFNGYPPTTRHEVAHLDGNPLNNVPSNLIWATAKENASHKVLHGTSSIGERNGAARMKEGQVEPIFCRYVSGESAKSIADSFGCCVGTILGMIRRRSWKHVNIHHELSEKAAEIAQENIRSARRENNARRQRNARGIPRPKRIIAIQQELPQAHA